MALAAACTGAVVATAPPLAADRASAAWLAAIHARVWPARAPAAVALVVIDPPTLAHPAFAARPRAGWSEPLARVVARVLDAGAAVVGVDVVLPRDDSATPAWLRTLRRARDGGRLVLGAATGAGDSKPSRAQVVAAGGVDGLGVVDIDAEADGVVRRMAPTVGGMPTLAAALAARTGTEPAAAAWLARGALPAVTVWSAAGVLDCGREPLAAAFAGRAVLVGAWLPREDRHPTSFGALPRAARRFTVAGCGASYRVAADGRTPGVLIHAIAFAAWHTGPQPARWPRALEVAFSVGAALAAARGRGRYGALALAAAVLAWTATAVAAFPTAMLPWLSGAAAAVTGATVAAGVRALHSAREFAAALPRAFRRAPHRACTREVTACFIDIASFTEATEALADPAAVAHQLAACLARLEATVVAHDGHVDKYLGDGLLALFGVDGGHDGAVAAARACLAACSGPRALRYGGRDVALRIGLARGAARVGPLGRDRLHFTAVGDPVNLAARLEQLNKELGTRVLADGEVAAGTPGAGWRDRGEYRIRGRRGPVRVFELTVSDECL